MDLLRAVRIPFWWVGVLPLAAVAWATFRRRLPSPDVRILAVAFAISFVADLPARYLSAEYASNIWLTYLYIPLQFGLVLHVVAPRRGRAVVWLFFGLLVAASLLRGPWHLPEAIVQVVAGGWIGFLVLGRPSRYRMALLVYFGAAVPFLLVRSVLEPALTPVWLVSWLGYQACRVTGLTLFAWAVLRPEPDDERVLGFPDRSVAGPDRDGALRADRVGRGAGPAGRRGRLATQAVERAPQYLGAAAQVGPAGAG